MSPVQLEYAVHDGTSLKGDLYLPPKDAQTTLTRLFPIIIAFHGGAWTTGGTFGHKNWGPWLSSHGIALFTATYRLVPSEKTGRQFPECFWDARAAVQFAKGKAEAWGVDASRMVLMGDSAGGQLAALVALAGDIRLDARTGKALIKNPLLEDFGAPGPYPADPFATLSTRVRACITIYAVLDLYEQFLHDQVSRSRNNICERLLGVSALDDKRAYFDASPTSYITGKDPSTSFLIVYGTRDDVVDPERHSVPFLSSLKAAGYWARQLTMEGAGHFWVWEDVKPEERGNWNGVLAPQILRLFELLG